MSANVTRENFVSDLFVAQPQHGVLPGRVAMMAMIAVLLLALAATVKGRGVGDLPGGDNTDVLMQGP